MLPVEVDSTGYVDAIGQIAAADRGVVDAVSTLSGTLSGCGSMAGTDTGGAEWAGVYDPAAGQLVQAGCSMSDALANMANLLNGSLTNHAGADHAAMLYPGAPAAYSGDSNPDHATSSISAPAPPAALGGTGGQPSWWHWIASHVGGLLWPDADTGKLRTAGAAWTTAGSAISNQQWSLYAADTALYAITSPEMDDVHKACTSIQTHLDDLGTAFTAIGNACNDYAQHVDDKHQEMEDELKSFVEWTIGIEAGGAILGALTFGAGEALAQIGEGAEVANAAQKVVRILNELIALARTVKTAIETAVKAIGELAANLAKFVNARLVTALEKVGIKVVEDAPAELRGGTRVADGAIKDPHYGEPKPDFGESPELPGKPEGPSGYDHVGDPEAPYGRLPDGQPMTKAEYDARYTDGDGHPRWPDNNGAVEGTRVRYDDPQKYVDAYGNKVDRIGGDGAYMGVMKDGEAASYEARSMPAENVGDTYSSYSLDASKIPDGWTIETGKVAPAFGRAGGAEQMYVANAAGRRIPVSTLVKMGVLS